MHHQLNESLLTMVKKKKKKKNKRKGKNRRLLRLWWIYAIAAAAIVVVAVLCLKKCDTPTPRKGSIVSDSQATADSIYQLGDLNPVQLATAQELGITPAETRHDLETQLDTLVNIANCDDYRVDYMEHSMPYLTPGAAQLLIDIGKGFRERLQQQDYREHRIIVTSALRSMEDQKTLSKSNMNAARQSAHCYATTFDITYTRFYQPAGDGHDITVRQLANVLGATLKELRDAGRCHVKYEMRQHCFHITSRR